MPSREAVSSEMAMGQAHRLSGGDAKDAGSNDAKGKQYFPSMREYKSALLDLFRVKSTIDATAQEAVAENTCSALMLEAHGGLGAESSFASHVTSRHASVAAAKHTSLLPSMIEHSHDSRTAQRSKLSIIGGRGALTDYEDADIFRVQSHTQRPMVCNDVLTIGRSPKRAQTKPSAHAACSLHTSNQLHAPHEDTASHVGSPQSQSETDEHALTSLSTTPTAERRMRASFQTGEAPAPASPGPGSQGALASWHMPARVRRRSVEMSSVEPQGQSGGSDGMHELPAIPGAQLSPQQHTANGGSKRSSSVSQSSHYSNEAANQDALCRDHALLPALNRKGGGYALPPATKEDTGQAGRAFFPELGSMVPSASSGPQLSIASKLQLKGPAKNLGGQSGSPPHKVHVATAHSEGSICLDGTKRRGSQVRNCMPLIHVCIGLPAVV